MGWVDGKKRTGSDPNWFIIQIRPRRGRMGSRRPAKSATLLIMSRALSPQPPAHHLLVEGSNWSALYQARRTGAAWEDLRTSIGLSALGVAILEGSAMVVQTLLEMGAPVETSLLFNGAPFSPLWSALEKRHPAIVTLLLQAGCDPNEVHPTDPDLRAPLLYAAEHALGEETIALCQAGAVPNPETPPSPLWLWIRHLTPRQESDGTGGTALRFPDSRPLIALLKSGAWVHSNDEGVAGVGVSELDLAKRHWLAPGLPPEDEERARLTLALMEENVLNRALGASQQAAAEEFQEQMALDFDGPAAALGASGGPVRGAGKRNGRRRKV